METSGSILNSLRTKAGLSREQLANLTKVDSLIIEAYETGYMTTDISFLKRVAEIFGVSLAFVAGVTETTEVMENPEIREVYVVNGLGATGLPRLQDVLGTAYMSRKETRGGEYYAFIAQDDSMTKARIQKGDVLIVRIQNYANNNDIVVALSEEGNPMVRRYRREGNIVTLTSETPRPGFDAIKIDTRETNLVISGVVKEVRMKLK